MKLNKRVSVGLAIIAMTLSGVASQPADAASAKPNILFIAVEDLRPELACYGRDYIKSPNIDRIGKAGIVLNRAYCQPAVCSPTRSPGGNGPAEDSSTTATRARRRSAESSFAGAAVDALKRQKPVCFSRNVRSRLRPLAEFECDLDGFGVFLSCSFRQAAG